MKPSENIGKLIKKLHIMPSAEMHQNTLSDIFKAQKNSKKTQSAGIQPNIGKIIMKNIITKYAATAVIIIALLFGINQFGGSIDMASVAFGDVREAFLAQPWVHIIYDNEREEWMNIREGKHFYISEFGWRFLADYASNTRLGYSLNSDHISEYTPRTYPEGNVPPWEPRIAWEAVLGFLEEGEERVLGEYTDIEKRIDKLDGLDAVRFDIYSLDALDNRVLATQLWADPESRLPIRIRSKLTFKLREITGVDYITGEYDFPDTGPESIFDLDVPSDLKIVSRVGPAGTTSMEVQQILQASEKAAQGFPKRYRAIVCSSKNGKTGEVDVFYRGVEKLHFSHYFNLDETKYPDCHINIQATIMEILAWTEDQIPVEVGVFDGVNVFHRSNVHPYVNVNEKTSVRVYRASTHFLPPWFYLEEDFWPHVYRQKRPLELIANYPETPSGCIALSDGKVYYFVDPLKDYVAVKKIETRTENGTQQIIWETSLSNFVQLTTRNWYPQERHYSFHGIDPKIEPYSQVSKIVDIQLLQEEDIPFDLFVGEKLLEGAEINTY